MIIVNFADNHFRKGQRRLSDTVTERGGNIMLFDRYQQIKSPTHKDSPYQFKIHSLEKAMQSFPDEDIFLWCDASLYAVGDLSKIETIIEQDGYFMEEAGHYVRDWCNDHTRKYFNLKPEETGFTMFSAGFLGLNRKSPIAMEFFTRWKASAIAGCFRGSWLDHRHDQTCASIIAQRMGLKYQSGGSHLAYIGPGYAPPLEGVVFHLCGIL